MKVSDKLTQIAELTINSILKSVYQEFILKYGEPEYILNGVKKKANFGIVAYGKLGGLELSYGSDLDLVFLHDSEGDDQFTNGKSSIDNDIFFSRLSQKLILLLTTQTNTGALYNIDTRLRPSGNSGLLISSIKAFDNYQRDKAWVWEHQALLRSRIVAGSTEIIETYNKIRREVLMYSIDHANLKNEVLKMRIRMRGQLDKSNDDTFDLKNGVGGIGDIEFLVQYLVLLYARRESGLIFFTDNIRQLDALSVASIITSEQKNKLQEIYKNFRRKIHLLNLNGKSNIIHKKDFHSEREVVINIWNDYFNK
jgi:glutamate-ammonia-ligase adenylyltransferase